MAVSFINNGEKVARQDIESCPKWFIFDIDLGTGADEVFTLMSTAEDVIIVDAFVDCVRADVGATASAVSLQLTNQAGASDDVFTASADNLGTVGRDSSGTGPTPSDYPRTAANTPESLVANYDVTGTATTSPQARVGVLMYRLERPGSQDHLPSTT